MDSNPVIVRPNSGNPQRSSKISLLVSLLVFSFGALIAIWGLFGIFDNNDGWNFLGILPLGLGSIVCIIFSSVFPKSIRRWVRVFFIGLLGFIAVAILALVVFTIFGIMKGG